ncbi:MAG: phospho-sugar mutase, partial [Clostridia bacterium]|nr:phospho-sugar mutase [Clostridia bacterium]
CLLLNYILSCKSAAGTLPADPVVVKTNVTTNLVARIAEKYGCELRNVLTGFKYIGEQIGMLEEQGHPERYILGFEESYGYLAGTYVRDKDAVVASMLICEMAAYYKDKGQSLLQVLDALYQEHGAYRHLLVNAEFEGEQGMATMQNIMTELRENRPANIAGLKIVGCADYLNSVQMDLVHGTAIELLLPKSNVLSFDLEGGAGVIVRPSGTEPKIKAYVTATGTTVEEANAMADTLRATAAELLKG